MILTVSKNAAAVINRTPVNNLFPDMQPCGEVSFDNGERLQPIFHGMKIIITQNRDHIVNGQQATIVRMQNKTVFLKLPSEAIVAVYPVTNTVNITTCHKTTYQPFLPAYPSVICKVQGQNLGKIMLWLDRSIVS